MTRRSAFWRRAAAADAPYFRTAACPTCRAAAGEHCTRGVKACQTRIEAALAAHATTHGEV